jgi:hypothetical protein
MGWLGRWLRQRWQRNGRKGTRLRKVCPLLNELETRVVPAVTASDFIDHGGPVLDHVQLEVVYLGSAWNSSALQPTVKQIDTFMQYLVASPFMSTLAQYGVSPGQATDSVVVPDALASNVTPNQIQMLLDQHIADGALAPADSNRLYVVFTPPNVTVSDNPRLPVDFLGYHSSLLDNQNHQDAFAVIPYPGGSNPQDASLNPFASLTDTTSHELAEAVTDPYTDARGRPTGWDDYTFDPNGNIDEGEVADIASTAPPVYLNGYAVTQLWSNQANSIVAAPGSTTSPGTSALTVTAQNVGNAVVNQSFTAVVANVIDTAASVTASNLTATIDWGDGSTPDTNVPVSATAVAGQFTVQGTHTYTASGSDTITVTVTDSSSGATASGTSTATVTAPGTTSGITVTGENVTAVTGQPFFAAVATVSDPGAFRGELVAQIDWGDGSRPSFVWAQGTDTQGNFVVDGRHLYAARGNYTLTVTVYDRETGAMASGTATANVADSGALSVTAQRVDATAGTSFTGTVATVTDPGASAADLTATINWGDGKVDTNVPVTTDRNGNLIVQGTHTYANVGHDPITVTVDDAKTGNRAQDFSFADVDPAPSGSEVHAMGVNVNVTPGQGFSNVIAVVSAPGASASDLTVTVDWGDGTKDSNVQVVPFGTDGKFALVGTHTYTNAGQYTIAVTVNDTATGATASSTSTANVENATTTTSTTTTEDPPISVTTAEHKGHHRLRHHRAHRQT